MFEVKETKFAINYKDFVSITRIGRYRWAYEAGPRVLLLRTDSGINEKEQPVEVILFPRNTRWERPYESELISGEEYEHIKSHLREGITALSPNSVIEFSDKET